ncbi:MAG: MFS transporter [Acidobacteriota bacterium]|nr:MFS transporter [Acidobacteriota bacterium]
MLFLGFSSGLPFLLVYSTLSAWLRQAGIQLSTIGMMSWVGFAYSFEFVFSPFVDRVKLPLLHRLLGRRRSWMLLAQIGIAAGLARLAAADPLTGVGSIAVTTLFIACCSATQDVAMNGWRIESVPTGLQGAMVATYSTGYRVAMIAAGAGAMAIAAGFGWHLSYGAMAALMAVGILTTLLVEEPRAAATPEEQARETRVVAWLERRAHWPRSLQKAGEWFIGAVICPLTDFFSRYGLRFAVPCLLFVGLYEVTEFTMGSMANPFYIDHHYTLNQIAVVGKFCGFTVGIGGVFLAGALVARVGLARSLAAGMLLAVLSNLSYSLLATTHTATLLGLGLTNGLDNLALSVQSVALITLLSSLTSPKYTATQYALFASIYALPGKFLEGTSGFMVRRLGYPHFFLYTASLSLPGLLLLAWLWRRLPRGRQDSSSSGSVPSSRQAT